jgi:osmoprotectant transport system substrate-binding protein
MPRSVHVYIRRLVACAGLALAATGLAACGSSSRPASADTATSQANTAARRLPGAGRPAVTIGDKNFTEQFVIGELYYQALTAQGYSVMLNRNIGPTEVTIEALASGRLGMYPEYLSVWNGDVAGSRRTFRTARAAYQAAEHYALRHGFVLLDATPFSDTSAIAVSNSYARDNGLRTIDDLRAVAPSLTIGAAPQFRQSETGLPALERAYDLVPAGFKSLDIGGQYQALEKGTVQAATVNTTDGELLGGRYTLLQDPRRAFGWGNVIPVVSARLLDAEGPAFAATINRVSALLTTTAMRRLNAAVDIYQQDPAAVAKQFLLAHGLLTARQG